MEKLYIGIKGVIVCLNKNDGQEIWRTKLRTAELTNVYSDGEYLFAYANGHLFCLASSNGEVLWENTLKGLGYGACIIAGEQNADIVASQMSQQHNAVAAVSVAGAASTASSE